MNRGWKKLERRILDGRGQGHGDRYLPWLWIRRKNTSAKGNQVAGAMPGYRRSAHFLARVEWYFGLLCLYLGARDVREQFPLWPMAHVHPLDELFRLTGKVMPLTTGLLEIARQAGIEHGSEVGFPGVPYVASIDLAVTLAVGRNVRLVGVSLKPLAEVREAEPTDRMLERLELERRYFNASGDRYVIADQTMLGRYTGANLEAFSAASQLPSELSCPRLISDYSERLAEVAMQSTISEGISQVGAAMHLTPFNSNLLWRNAVWTRRIPIDLTLPIELGRPLAMDNGVMARAMATELFGEVV